MLVKAVFSEKQPSYRYMNLGNGMADVFVLNYIGEEINEEDNSTSFIYEMNEFRVDSNAITEEMIKDDPMEYLHYSSDVEKIALEERVSAIEDAIVELAEVFIDG